MDKYEIIKKPLITEKGTMLQSFQNAYPFEVAREAEKADIKEAIEAIYGVKVKDVRTMNRKGKPKRRGYTQGHKANWKKAIVVLEADSVIDLF